MNTEAITSHLGKEVIRVYGDLFDKQEKEFLLHYEDLGTRVLSSKDELLEFHYLEARKQMDFIVYWTMLSVVQEQVGKPLSNNSAFLQAVNTFRSQVRFVILRAKAINIL